MTGYTKLFGSIVASTIWREPHTVRIVWITMLAMANKNGIVEASLPGLADLSRVSLAECKEALAALMSPDEYSRTPDFEGRRIEPCDGGWKVLNHAKYRAKMGVDERREYLRIKQQENRAKKKTPRQQASTVVNNGVEKSTVSTHAEAEAETETDAESKEKKHSERGEKFAEWFKTLIPADSNLASSWKASWAKCFDDMMRLDKRTDEQIMSVCKWARSDSFWSSNFQSPLKLRDRNKDKVQYFDVFSQKMKAPAPNAPQKPATHIPRESTAEKLERVCITERQAQGKPLLTQDEAKKLGLL